MAASGVSSTGCEKLYDRCSPIYPDLYDRATRLSWGLKLSMVLLHVIFVGVIFAFDFSLIRRTREEPWYTAAYMVVFSATLFQYFFTSCSSPGYVIDAMRAANGTSTTFNNPSSILKQSNSRDGYIICSMNNHHLEAQTTYFNSSSWLKLVMDLYPPGSAIRNWTCSYCNIVQPPRAKHCHDCDKCILQFDHHCVWLGTCVGQGNHCPFWWYIFLETILCIWTVVLYISYLRSEIEKTWWKDFIVIVLLAALMFCLIFLILLLLFHRGIPEKVHPFSRGICKNLYTFCCSSHSIRDLEAVSTMEDIEASARPYTCLDVVMCRCC